MAVVCIPPLLGSGSGDRAAVDGDLGPRDGAGTRRYEKGDEVGDLPWPGRSSERNAAERLHDELLAAFAIGAGIVLYLLGAWRIRATSRASPPTADGSAAATPPEGPNPDTAAARLERTHP